MANMAEEEDPCCSLTETVKIAGYLEKKGKTKIRSYQWKKYWFVLDQQLLLYYKSPLDHESLSPCRGSLNMGLVTSVQSAEPQNVINILTRAQLVQLRASDRVTQQNWIKVLSEAIPTRKSNLADGARFRFSLDNLPKAGQKSQTATLPRRNNATTGSLDQMFRPFNKQKKFERQLTYVADADENQNMYSTVQKSSKLTKIKDVIVRKKDEQGTAVGKKRRESFLYRMFKRTSPTRPIEIEEKLSDSDLEDPLYDTIGNVSEPITLDEEKLKIGVSIMPQGAMDELREKLRSRESLENIVVEKKIERKVPPELPPRKSSRPDYQSDEVIVVSVEPIKEDHEEILCNREDVQNQNELTKQPNENNNLSQNQNKDLNLLSDEKQEAQHPAEMYSKVVQKSTPRAVPDCHVEINENTSTERINRNNELGLTQNDSTLNADIFISNDITGTITDKDNTKLLSQIEPKIPVNNGQILETDIDTKEVENTSKCLGDSSKSVICNDHPTILEASDCVNSAVEYEINFSENFKADSNSKDDFEQSFVTEKNAELKDNFQILDLKNRTDSKPKIKSAILKPGISEDQEVIHDDLDSLLEKLTKISSIPISPENEDPDYDIPRPHGILPEPEQDISDRIPATEFFSRIEDIGSQNSSLEPDSLEGKKESAITAF